MKKRREQKERKFENHLVQWRLLSEKKTFTKDKEILLGLIGVAGMILSIIFENYTFAALLFVATVAFILLGRQKQKKKLTFKITNSGIMLDDDFIPIEEIKSFNIIDDPGARARLILKIEKIIHTREIVPIYDVDSKKIEGVFKKLGIEKEEDMIPGTLDTMTRLII